jgi:predicted homoserine dehydrogenase-like protein
MVEVISSLREDGSHVGYDIRQGIWVCVEADTDYIRNCFEEYGLVTDSTGRYSAMYKRFHLIGLELGMSVAHVGARREPTGTPTHFIGDVCAVSKGQLRSGTVLDGEGGATVYGGLRPAQHSTAGRYLPLGLSHAAVLKRDIALDEIITLDDVEIDSSPLAFTLRAETEALLES